MAVIYLKAIKNIIQQDGKYSGQKKDQTILKENQHIALAVSKVKKNDQSAMHLLYTNFAKSMLNLSYRITNDLAKSEDIIQECFLKSFQEIENLKEPSKYGFWLKRIVANQSISSIKKTIKFESLDAFEAAEEEEEDWYKNISFAIINSAIQKLPNGCKEVFCLYLLDGFKHKEIAKMLSTSESNAKSQYRYALKLLRVELKNYRHV